jgi:hypothetical protein
MSAIEPRSSERLATFWLVMDELDPPSGRVRAAQDCGEREFVGWLGLLRALSELLEDRVRLALETGVNT